MKVLVLTESSEPSRYWSAAIPLLIQKGVDASFATIRGKGELSKAFEEANIPVFAFDAKSAIDYPKAAWRLSKVVREKNFDIVHASESISASVSGVSSFISRKPIRLFHRHHNECPQKTWLFHNLANKTSDFMMTCSGATKRFAHEVDGFDEKKIMVVYNGINPLRDVSADEISKIRHDLDLPENAKVISIVAKIRQEKGHRTLFEAAKIVAESISEPIHIIVTGSGAEEEALKIEAKAFDSFTVHFTGHQQDVAPWFAVGDVVAMPSYIEPFGLVATEAMSIGKPLIASGVDGLLEVVEDNVSGILVPPKNGQRLAEAIIRVLENPSLAKNLGENARTRVREKFSMENMVDSWIGCYEYLMKHKASLV